jgi:hypothetical protein
MIYRYLGRSSVGRIARPVGRLKGFRNAALAGARLRALAEGLSAEAARPRCASRRSRRARSRGAWCSGPLVKMNAYGAMAAKLHPWYIERDDVEKDGSKGLLYGPDGPAEDIEAPRPGEKHRFRLIVSPEDAGALDLTKYVRGLMAQVENDVGRRLEWAAVNHVDTDHPHAHERRATDRRSCCPVRGRREARREIDDRVLLARLEHLETMRLERVGPSRWELAEGRTSRLRELGTGRCPEADAGGPARRSGALTGSFARGRRSTPGLVDPTGRSWGMWPPNGSPTNSAARSRRCSRRPGVWATHVPLDRASAEGVSGRGPRLVFHEAFRCNG